MTPSWSHQTHSIVFRPKRFGDSWGRYWWLSGINPRFLAFRILKINHFSSPVTIRCRNFCLASRIWHVFWRRSICLSFNSCSTHFPIFWTFSMAWKWLLEKHPIVRQAFFAIGYRPRPKEPAIDSPQSSRFSRFLSFRSKLSSLNRRNQSLHVVSDKTLSP